MNQRQIAKQIGTRACVSLPDTEFFRRPVMYLDIDDTLLTYNDGVWEATYGRLTNNSIISPNAIIAAPGAGEFIVWALEHFEIRWLTFWCPSGRMHPKRAEQLAGALGVSPDLIASIEGISFAHSLNKCDGIDWSEHERGRPWIWIEDDLPQSELQILASKGCLDRWYRCNVTEDVNALRRLHMRLKEEIGSLIQSSGRRSLK